MEKITPSLQRKVFIVSILKLLCFRVTAFMRRVIGILDRDMSV